MKILNLKVYYKQFYNEYFDLVHSSCSNNNYYLIIIISHSLLFCYAMPNIIFRKLTDYEYHNANLSCQNE